MTRTEVIARIQVEGTHCWKTCPIEEVSFLRSPHRHVFHVEMRKAVSHDDRDVEIIMLGREAKNYLLFKYSDDMGGVCDFDGMSCEMIARELLDKFKLSACTVTEDGENGACITEAAVEEEQRKPWPITSPGKRELVLATRPTVWIVPIEPLDSRYTKQWHTEVPDRLAELRAEIGADCNIYTINGREYDRPTSGGFFDFALTNAYKASQVEVIAELFNTGAVNPGDHFLFTDAWNTAAISVRYMSDMLGIPVKMSGIWHAGAYDKTDLLGMKAGEWARGAEESMFACFDYNYFATQSHIDIFNSTRSGRGKERIRCGQPHYAIMRAIGDEGNFHLPKTHRVIWPHRLSPDKQTFVADGLKTSGILITQRYNLTKEEMYDRCRESWVVLSAALHENLGIGVMEATLGGALPLVPDRCSYAEMYLPQFRYPSEWTQDEESFIKHEQDLRERIDHLIIHRAKYEESWREQRKILFRDYLSADSMLLTILNHYTKQP